MAKSFRLLKNDLQRVSLILELADARIPMTSRNPKIKELVGDKDHLLVLTKTDLADPAITNQWKNYFIKRGERVTLVDLKRPDAYKLLERSLQPYRRAQNEKDQKRGRKPRPLTIAALGIPNVGKSTLANLLVGKQSHATENRPGLTRQISFIRSRNQRYELMDSPGLLWPKLETVEEQAKLALCMAIPDQLLSLEELALDFFILWSHLDPDAFKETFKSHPVDSKEDALNLLRVYAFDNNILEKGGLPDTSRAAERIIRDFRKGGMGRISLEQPQVTVELPQ